jgi:hypothetical protein
MGSDLDCLPLSCGSDVSTIFEYTGMMAEAGDDNDDARLQVSLENNNCLCTVEKQL